MASPTLSVTVIGIGNWGTSLAAALGGLPHVRHSRVHAERMHSSLKSRAARPRLDRPGLARPPLDAQILWLCVPDGAITETAQWITRHRPDLTGQLVVHSSGALDRGALWPAERAGARTASVHPMMSFPTRRPVSLRGVRFGVETGDLATRRRLFSLVRGLGGRPFAVEGSGKASYHAGAMFGSPFLVATLAAGVQAMAQAGIPEEEALALLLPMATATVANVARQGLARSFSGPLARGDQATVNLHRAALARHPLVAQLYDAFAAVAAHELPAGSARRPAARGRRSR